MIDTDIDDKGNFRDPRRALVGEPMRTALQRMAEEKESYALEESESHTDAISRLLLHCTHVAILYA